MVEFNYIYRHYYAYISKLTREIINDDPEDIVQMTFIKLNESEYALKEEKLAVSFCKTVAKNLCITYLRKQKHKRKREYAWHENVYGNYLEPNEDMQSEIEKQIELSQIHTDVIEFLYKKIKELPTNIRNVFELYFYKDKSIEQISEELKINKQSVRNNLSMARKILKVEILFHKKDVLQLLTKRPTL